MRHVFAVLLVGCVTAIGGCKESNQSDNDTKSSSSSTTSDTKSSDPKMMSTKDDCPHCKGVQTANADGKCPVCGMKVK